MSDNGRSRVASLYCGFYYLSKKNEEAPGGENGGLLPSCSDDRLKRGPAVALGGR